MYVNERVNEVLMIHRTHCWKKRKYVRDAKRGITMRIYSFGEFRSTRLG